MRAGHGLTQRLMRVAGTSVCGPASSMYSARTVSPGTRSGQLAAWQPIMIFMQPPRIGVGVTVPIALSIG